MNSILNKSAPKMLGKDKFMCYDSKLEKDIYITKEEYLDVRYNAPFLNLKNDDKSIVNNFIRNILGK